MNIFDSVVRQAVHCFVVAADFRHWWQGVDTFWDGHHSVFWGQALQSDHGLYAREVRHHGTEGAVWAHTVRGEVSLMDPEDFWGGICFENYQWNGLALLINVFFMMLVKCVSAEAFDCVIETYSEFFHFRLPNIKLQI